MTIIHIFKSGNGCVIDLPASFQAGYSQFRVEWLRRPSRKDLREYRDVVLPKKVHPVVRNAVLEVGRSDEALVVVQLDQMAEAADGLDASEPAEKD